MKNKFLLILGVLFILGFTSCTKWIDPEINKDPDSPTSVPMDLILPAVEVNLGYVFGGFDVAGITSIWMQQAKGQDRQALAIDGYNLTEADVNNLWNDIYTGPLMDLKDILSQAEESGADNYKGVAKVLQALTLGTMVGLYGDIPFSDALNMYPPTYDSEEQIYNTIQQLLDEAINLLDPTSTVNNDLIFDGDLSMWIKAAYTLKARYALRISNQVPPNWNDVISWVDDGLEAEDVMAVPFSENSTENNPMYQYLIQRSGYIADNSTFLNVLEETARWGGSSDPRDGILFLGDDGAQGPYTQNNSPVILVSGVEGLFIKAEAYYRNNDVTNAREELINGVEAALEMLGIDPAGSIGAYTTYVGSLTGDDLLEEIIIQKWIANFLNAENWADYRRTGYPVLTPVTGQDLPQRYPYPSDERSYNPNTPDYGSIFISLWFVGSSSE